MLNKVTELAEWWGMQGYQTSYAEFMSTRPHHALETAKYVAQIVNAAYSFDETDISATDITGMQRVGRYLYVKINYEEHTAYQIPLSIFEDSNPMGAANAYGELLYKQVLREQEDSLERKLAHIRNILRRME